MHSKAIVAAATAFVALLPTTLAGKAKIENKCPDTLYMWPIAHTGSVEKISIAPGDSYEEEMRTNDNGGGISLKLGKSETDEKVSQFEYTLSPDGDKVFYDLSNIDGYPFADDGVTITPSDGSCPVVTCPAGEELCKDAYNVWNDDHATKGCPSSTDLTMTVCTGGNKKRHPRQFTV
ncbi:hypothetical protein AJ79_04316 [Helicocarpus griseus UAMH5409]|uniref:Antigenic thaumatin-like protein n=1 Tax=Helicocarpus griseus UAMH5409 TaxID=1447875 RepID=A0A2B7XUW5_9EURO|nr:hypothetical protein AJ79_04316 [Helicocarpus griseus UAMH5409]